MTLNIDFLLCEFYIQIYHFSNESSIISVCTLLYKWCFKIQWQHNSFIHHRFAAATPDFVPAAGDMIMHKDRHRSCPHRGYYLRKDQAFIEYSYKYLRNPRHDTTYEGKVCQDGPWKDRGLFPGGCMQMSSGWQVAEVPPVLCWGSPGSRAGWHLPRRGAFL